MDLTLTLTLILLKQTLTLTLAITVSLIPVFINGSKDNLMNDGALAL